MLIVKIKINCVRREYLITITLNIIRIYLILFNVIIISGESFLVFKLFIPKKNTDKLQFVNSRDT